MKKPIIIISIMFCIILILSVLRVVVANSMSTSGIALDGLDRELSYYKTQNTILKEKLLTITSLDYIASKASVLGFAESKSNISLNVPLPLAIRQ